MDTFVAPVRNLETFPAQAIQFFEEAIRLEPGPALAHTGIGMTHVAMYDYGFCGRETAYEAALRSVRTALDADRRSSQAFVLKASVYSMFDRDFKLSDESLDRAIELNRSNADAYQILRSIDRVQVSGGWTVRLPVRSYLDSEMARTRSSLATTQEMVKQMLRSGVHRPASGLS